MKVDYTIDNEPFNVDTVENHNSRGTKRWCGVCGLEIPPGTSVGLRENPFSKAGTRSKALLIHAGQVCVLWFDRLIMKSYGVTRKDHKGRHTTGLTEKDKDLAHAVFDVLIKDFRGNKHRMQEVQKEIEPLKMSIQHPLEKRVKKLEEQNEKLTQRMLGEMMTKDSFDSKKTRLKSTSEGLK